MKRQTALVIFLAFVLIGAGCATAPKYDPFKVSKDELKGKIKTIARTPVFVPDGLQDPASVQARFESLIEAKLTEAGFTLVPSEEYDKIWERRTENIGGFFDPVTGKRDESKIEAVRKDCLRDLCTKFNADAVLYSEIRIVRANIAGQKALWHGTSEDFRTGGKLLKFLDTSMYSGAAPALSLVITIRNVDDVCMYLNAGGIQLASRLERGEFVPVPRSQLFSNEERNIAAVNIALDPLVMEFQAPEAKQ